MKKLNKLELIDIVAERAHLSKKDAKAAIDCYVDAVEKALIEGTEVNITNFGVFTPKVTKEREGTNPKTHQRLVIKSKKTITFRVAKELKAKLN